MLPNPGSTKKGGSIKEADVQSSKREVQQSPDYEKESRLAGITEMLFNCTTGFWIYTERKSDRTCETMGDKDSTYVIRIDGGITV